ncbi:polyribonucleotide nucleotidyltransferase [Candidatus Pelagisphaera phototrophica]|uniref:polyribonucleotide nucleotidyltransferase n=1 Tax=Candidatus Pelagisphaera phototrophica TaxID=2684113 RepID=UPI0019F17124|nr:polyribonucleotide nucleotidyltransferase [Candidatus Pelagisphaera phototrophica]QXD33418.1 polyribonucleotide nucleotidyltransferase [Candidatus Pelagisphaera phototrophica]
MIQKHSVTIDALNMTISTGDLAQLASGSVTVTVGETCVFVSATAASTVREGQDWFPLTVDYREKYAAAGRIPGGYFKREARPTEKEILTSRLCDRPCRPLFPKGFLNEVQIIGFLLSTDKTNEPDISMLNGASAALAISDIPWNGPIGAVRVGRIDGEFVTNPTLEEQYASELDLIYVGTKTEMLMIEGSAAQLPEDDFIAALEYAHEAIQPIIAGIDKLVSIAGKEKSEFPLVVLNPEVREFVENLIGEDVNAAARLGDKQERNAKMDALKEKAGGALKEKLGEESYNPAQLSMAMEEMQEAAYRAPILESQVRSGGRGPTELRDLHSEVGLLPRVHGSALFSRGETQALVFATLGPTNEAQRLDAVTGGPESKSFMLHYNFPPFSVGEAGRFGFTGRREIGHGALAERSLLPVVPAEDHFAYSIRIVSEVMASNGSTSMASICGGCLALMDAGVPISDPVAGISCGLVTENGSDGKIAKHVLLTDILGEEDHFGDMDFKIAGTRNGITGFQLDLKINGLPFDIMRESVAQSRDARIAILDSMAEAIDKPRENVSENAPRITTVQINPEKIGALIGPGGKNIRRIVEITGAQLDIDDDNSGKVNIYATSEEAMNRAIQEIDLVCGEIEEGKIYRGVVKAVKEFGCFVEVLPGQEGLVHISELADFRVKRTEDVCKPGDEMVVKCIGIDEKGRVRLSRKAALEELEARKAASSESEGEPEESDSSKEVETENAAE